MKMLVKLVVLCCAFVAFQAEVPEVLTQDVIDVFTNEHNRVRANAGVGTLTWDQTLSEFAAFWGSSCVFQLSKLSDNAAIAAHCVRDWEAEKKYMNNPNYREEVYESYLLVVESEIKKVGCAIIRCQLKTYAGRPIGDYVICEYSSRDDVRIDFEEAYN